MSGNIEVIQTVNEGTITATQDTCSITMQPVIVIGGKSISGSATEGVDFNNVLFLDNLLGTFYNPYSLSINGIITFELSNDAKTGATDRVVIEADGTTALATEENLQSIFVEGLEDLPDNYILEAGYWSFYFLKVPNGVALSFREYVGTVAPIPDTDKPVITILGSNPINVSLNSIYSDEGATAYDNKDGDITSSIITVDNVNTSIEDTYTVTYNVTDAAGNQADEAVRVVNVLNEEFDPSSLNPVLDSRSSVDYLDGLPITNTGLDLSSYLSSSFTMFLTINPTNGNISKSYFGYLKSSQSAFTINGITGGVRVSLRNTNQILNVDVLLPNFSGLDGSSYYNILIKYNKTSESLEVLNDGSLITSASLSALSNPFGSGLESLIGSQNRDGVSSFGASSGIKNVFIFDDITDTEITQMNTWINEN